jgi:hypothetical protein
MWYREAGVPTSLWITQCGLRQDGQIVSRHSRQ